MQELSGAGPLAGGGVSRGVAAALTEASVALWRSRPETVVHYAQEVCCSYTYIHAYMHAYTETYSH